jgi:hypothetical protein
MLDLVGLVVGYGMAALLIRSFWPSNKPLVGFPAVALGLEYVWLGLAMSGPIVLLIDRRSGSGPTPPRPKRPRLGHLISSKEAAEAPPVGRGPSRTDSSEAGPYTRAETAWIMIGGYWIALTLFVVSALSVREIVGFVGMIQVIAAVVLVFFVLPRRARPGASAKTWTHAAALAVLWTWPVAWVLLILLSGGI